ncbi:amidohydrolase family protein [Thalassomonas sp. M1454]|uniref:amidohydrolase family protein n=1 Tax=Thalassomonas sp. M1454 TaxID=2594477 RepID=UPI00117E0EC6|nr:amidohydrolase family protein [Thalassomonas sp. M1454]TRX55868.1 amidohydrolase family protein [Thalassomonas sp. M1454]
MAAIPPHNYILMDIIDPHLHLFDLKRGDYHWLKSSEPPFWPDKSILQQNFSEHDLTLASNINLVGFVHIEAGFDNKQPHRELEWLEQTCSLAFKSIAFAELSANDFALQLDKLEQFESFAGIRHILDEQLQQILQQPNTLANLQLLADKGLIFEAQFDVTNYQHSQLFYNTIKQCPNLKVVINHAGFPAHNKADEQYSNSLSMLASLDNCAIKCSGWEMQNRQWQISEVSNLINLVISVFGIDRVMLASNFPVSNLSTSYNQLWQSYCFDLLKPFSTDEKKQLSANNAKLFYGLVLS